MTLDGLHPGLRPYADYLVRVAQYYGLRPRITSVYRSYAMQQYLYERYLAGKSALPAAPPGRSKHQYGLAFDMVTTNPQVIGEFWKRMGGQWWPSDPVHFEAP